MRFTLYPRSARALFTAAALVFGIGLGPATAAASSVSYSAGTITFTTTKDETNHVVVQPWGLVFELTDTGVKGKGATPIAVTAGAGCWHISSNSATCPATATRLSADLADGDDFFDASLIATPTNVTGGAGNDELRGGTGADTLDGAGGNDSFDARDLAADTLVCGSGTDGGNADALDAIPADCEAVVRAVAPVTTIAPGPGSDPATSITDPVAVDLQVPPIDSLNPTTDPGSTPGGTDTAAANAVPASIPPQTVTVSASGVANVKVVCPADSGGCSGSVTIELPNDSAGKRHGKLASAAFARRRARAPLKIGRTRFRAEAGTELTVPVRLNKRGRQRIVKGMRSRAKIVVTTRKADGTTSVATQDVTIHAPAKRKARRR